MEQFLEECKHLEIQVVSGMALGIDAQAHKSALLDHGLDTVGVLAHPLNILYPQTHTSLAKEMLEKGSLYSLNILHKVSLAFQFPHEK